MIKPLDSGTAPFVTVRASFDTILRAVFNHVASELDIPLDAIFAIEPGRHRRKRAAGAFQANGQSRRTDLRTRREVRRLRSRFACRIADGFDHAAQEVPPPW